MKRLRRHYEAHFLVYELVGALAVSALLISLLEVAWGREHLMEALDGARQGLYIAIASIGGSLLGFAVTTVSIITGFVQFPGLRIVRESRHHRVIYKVFFSAVRYLALVTVVALAALIVDGDSSPVAWASYSVLTAVVIAIVRLYRCVWVLERVVTLAVERPNTSNQ